MSDIISIEESIISGRLRPITYREVMNLETCGGEMRDVILTMVREGKLIPYWDNVKKEVIYIQSNPDSVAEDVCEEVCDDCYDDYYDGE